MILTLRSTKNSRLMNYLELYPSNRTGSGMILFLTAKNSSCITRNKQSYRPSNGFDNIDGANYDLSLWVAYYNFLRPHEHAGYKVLNKVEKLEGASNMPGKWQLLIFLGQQRILKMQQAKGSNCS